MAAATDMGMMFFNAVAFNQALPFDTSSVVNMEGVFQGASAFSQPLSSWQTASVTDMSTM